MNAISPTKRLTVAERKEYTFTEALEYSQDIRKEYGRLLKDYRDDLDSSPSLKQVEKEYPGMTEKILGTVERGTNQKWDNYIACALTWGLDPELLLAQARHNLKKFVLI